MMYKYDMQNTTINALTARKVSEEVFQANPRTKSLRCTGSAVAIPLISSAIEGFWEPLYASTCNQTHMHRVNHTAHNSSRLLFHTTPKHSHMQHGVEDLNPRTNQLFM